MARIDGAFSDINPGYVRPYIIWTYAQSIAGNYTDVTADLYFELVNTSFYGYNYNNHYVNINIDGQTESSGDQDFDLSSSQPNILVYSKTKRVYHNADGSKSAYIGFDGNTNIYWGTYNFGQTVVLPTIPREAFITNSVNFTIGNNIPLTLTNSGNFYIKADLYVAGNLIKSQNLGQTTSTTLTLDGTNNSAIYALIPNTTSASMYVRIRTYTTSGYSTQIGGNRDKTGTVSVNQTTNKPIFTTFSIENVDKTVNVVDKYANALISSSTATLLGASTKIIKSYSKIRATIITGNKAVAQNSATMSKYRFVAGTKYVEATWSSGSTVTLDLDNVDVINNSVAAYDSRSLATEVSNAFSLMSNYFPVLIYGLKFVRDNGVDATTKIQFAGLLYNKYFSSDTTSNPGSGVLNAAVFEYRFKETTVAWGAQTWSAITPTIDGAGVIEFDDYVDGDLGVGGFDAEKSFDIEVRVYDKLSAMIAEETLSVGTPLEHFTKDKVAYKRRVKDTDSSVQQINGSITLDELTVTPTDPDIGVEGKLYIKDNKFIIQFNDSGTVRYKYLDLTGTGVTWTHSTTAP